MAGGYLGAWRKPSSPSETRSSDLRLTIAAPRSWLASNRFWVSAQASSAATCAQRIRPA